MARFGFLAATLIFALSASALAGERDMPPAASKPQFEAIKAHLISQLETDKFSEITPADKQAVLDVLNLIQSRYDRVATSDQLSNQDRVDMFNNQEIINTIITHAAKESRLICELSSRTGTHMMRLSCMTLATLRERGRVSKDAMLEYSKNNSYPGAESMKPADFRQQQL